MGKLRTLEKQEVRRHQGIAMRLRHQPSLFDRSTTCYFSNRAQQLSHAQAPQGFVKVTSEELRALYVIETLAHLTDDQWRRKQAPEPVGSATPPGHTFAP